MLDKSKKLENLYSFLTGKEEKGLIEERHYEHSSYYTYFTKIKSGVDSIDLIYAVETNSKDIIGIYTDMNFKGIYDNLNKVMYSSDFYYLYDEVSSQLLLSEKIKDVKFLSISDLMEDFEVNFRRTVISKVAFNEENLKGISLKEDKMDYILKTEAPREALKAFMDGKSKQDIDLHSYSKLNYIQDTQYSGDLLIKYLGNQSIVLEDKANEFIEERKESILWEILKTKQLIIELEKIEKDKKMIERRDVFSVLNDNSRKSINVYMLIKGKEFSCKIETCGYGYPDGEISEYNIIGKDKKEEYEGLFERNESTYTPFSAINEVKYSGKVIYEKKK